MNEENFMKISMASMSYAIAAIFVLSIIYVVLAAVITLFIGVPIGLGIAIVESLI